ncbi:MAG TPA: endonuclease domain-containing protein, partial [Stellaceae bacterium]|nr:endonuclease domain-containing protein [Stellaceae bacterium]
MTDAEQALWKQLRNHRLGWRFRRQFPIPPCIVDFACVDARLIVEADGGQHERPGDDELRDNELGRQGWRVLRFWNNQILANPEGVMSTIAEALGRPRERSPHPNPPPLAAGLSGETFLVRATGYRHSHHPQVVLRGLDPRIHAFVSAPQRRGWPGQARPRRSYSADFLSCSA